MENGDAECTVFIDVGVVERSEEAEGWEIPGLTVWEREGEGSLTRRRIGVVLGEGHGGLEIAAIVQRLWVNDDQGDVPAENVVMVKLDDISANDPQTTPG